MRGYTTLMPCASNSTRTWQIHALTSSVTLQSELIQLPKYVKRSTTSNASPWIFGSPAQVILTQLDAVNGVFVVSPHAPTDSSSETEKDEFYQDLSRMLRSARTDMVILVGDMNAQVGRLSLDEAQLSGPLSASLSASALRFLSALRVPKESSSVHRLRQAPVAEEYRADLARKLLETHSHVDNEDGLEDERRRVREAMLSAFRTAGLAHLTRLNEHWISLRSAGLITARKAIPETSDYDGARRSLKHRISRSFNSDRERWWISKTQEMQKAFAAGNSRALFQLIRPTGQNKAGMLPKGITLIGGTWKSVTDFLRSSPPFTEAAMVPSISASEEHLMLRWKNLLEECQSGTALPLDVSGQISSLLQAFADPCRGEPNFYLVRFLQRVCYTRTLQDDAVTPIFFHLLMVGSAYPQETVYHQEKENSHVMWWLLPINIQLLCATDQDWKKFNAEPLGAVERISNLTSVYLDALSKLLYDPTGFSPRHVSLSWIRAAYRFIVHAACQPSPENDIFSTAVGFLVVLEATEADLWHDFMLYFVRPMRSAVIEFYKLASASTPVCTQNVNSTSDTALLERFFVELDNLNSLSGRAPVYATTSYRERLSLLVCCLFDRLACIVLYAAGATSQTHPVLWNTLYTPVSLNPSSVPEALICLPVVKLHRVAETDDLPLTPFKDGDESLCSGLV
ncbi:hypothetical protein T265_12005 [Opisthorchis viverrini]|uniref:Uncharacterized protein n=1 Tax=Opisthorchis viverrini TaxID=6198 RepID=A0A074Z0W3_OPIVI|nr:hypothetical protein T265_12005 [Opisthorchis viverrini]KER19107.1 hypothetical protein T265_12005 [Opisthorchis viverrini]